MFNKNANQKKVTINRILIIVAVICCIFAVGIILLPFINKANVETYLKNSEEIGDNYATNALENEYYINTAQDLWDFAEEVNNGNTFKDVTVYLTTNIDLECSEDNQWIPIGDYNTNSANKFEGTFDGQSHIISGIYINNNIRYQGLFGYNGGIIKKLTINEGQIIDSSSCIGAISGYNTGSITEVINEVSITGGDNLGGICGRNYGEINSCQNKAIITGLEKVTGKQLGGISGFNGGTIINSTNIGIINGNESEGLLSGVGGIVGYNEGTIEECNNNAKINNPKNTGGIVGYNTEGTIINCTNIAEIMGESWIGGIVGDNNYRRNSDGYAMILNCSNTGYVKSTLTSGFSYVGGIAGSSSSSTEEGRAVIMKCKNTGLIEGSVYTGGICGFQGDGNGGDTSYIKKCWNSGIINSKVYGTENTAITYSNTGGIVGYNNCGFIDECYNVGEVGGISFVGGIAGFNAGVIKMSYNLGSINGSIDLENSSDYQLSKLSKSSAGGIVGTNYDRVENCYNAGKIVAGYASGLVQSNNVQGLNHGTVENCYTVGDIQAIEKGSIIGYNSRNDK